MLVWPPPGAPVIESTSLYSIIAFAPVASPRMPLLFTRTKLWVIDDAAAGADRDAVAPAVRGADGAVGARARQAVAHQRVGAGDADAAVLDREAEDADAARRVALTSVAAALITTSGPIEERQRGGAGADGAAGADLTGVRLARRPRWPARSWSASARRGSCWRP